MPPAGKDPVVLRKGNRIEEGHAEAARWPEGRETGERGKNDLALPGKAILEAPNPDIS